VIIKECSIFESVWVDVIDEAILNSKVYPYVLDCVNQILLADIKNWEDLDIRAQQGCRCGGRLEITDNDGHVSLENAVNSRLNETSKMK
jgi:hypothetical protein